MTRRFAILGLALAVLLCGGCASVTQGASHPLRIETVTDAGRMVDGADCTLTNDHAMMTVKSGQSTFVRRSSKDLAVVCTSSGLPDATARLVSRANVGLAGNILFGGGIGAVIDHSTGSAYTYPHWVRLVYGQHAVFDRNDEREGVVMLAPGTPEVVAAPSSPGTAGTTRRSIAAGDRFEYRVTDRGSGRVEMVTLRADDVDATQVSFNGGAHVERLTGEPVRLSAALLGELDQVTPPSGWMPGGRVPAGMWTMRYRSIVPASIMAYDLDAMTEGEQTLKVNGAELRVVRIVLRGWAESRNGMMPTRAQYAATAWLSPELQRVVRFEARSRAPNNSGIGYFEIDETAELVRMGR
jgi:hypothetical protein